MRYDNNRVYAECAGRNVVPIIPLRRNSGHREASIPRQERRSGIERVRLHADLAMLGRLSLALDAARATLQAASSVGLRIGARWR